MVLKLLKEAGMSYKIVEFENEEVAVVIETWLSPNKNNSYWPAISDRLSYVRALRKKQDADLSWNTYPISRILYETDNVEKALQKLKVAENTSNLETDFDESEIKPRRKRIKKTPAFFEDSEESEDSDSFNERIRRPPLLKFGSRAAVSSLSPCSVYESDCQKSRSLTISRTTPGNNRLSQRSPYETDISKSSSQGTTTVEINSIPCVADVTPKHSSFPKNLGSSSLRRPISKELPNNRLSQCSPYETDIPKSSSQGTTTVENNSIPCVADVTPKHSSFPKSLGSSCLRRPISKELSNVVAENCNCHQIVVNQLLPRLVKIEEQNNHILAAIRSQRNNLVSAPKFKTKFPINTLDELVHLDNELNDETVAHLVLYLASLGGEGVTSKTNRILKELLTDNLACQQNFCGGHDKHAFNKLKLKTVIVDSVKSTLKDASTTAVENAIKVWLKHAPQRVKLALARAQPK